MKWKLWRERHTVFFILLTNAKSLGHFSQLKLDNQTEQITLHILEAHPTHLILYKQIFGKPIVTRYSCQVLLPGTFTTVLKWMLVRAENKVIFFYFLTQSAMINQSFTSQHCIHHCNKAVFLSWVAFPNFFWQFSIWSILIDISCFRESIARQTMRAGT